MQKIIKYEVVSLELDSGFLSSKVDENDFTKLIEQKITKVLDKAINVLEKLRINGVMDWVACKDAMPNEGTYETWNGYKIVICEFEPIYKQFIGNTANGVKDDITHWKELPEPPCA